MEMRKLGRTGLKVAALCLGGNTFGWTTDQKASEIVLDAYMEAGGNFIDTADVYSRWAPGNTGGESETALGIWMAARKNRHAVVMASKVMGPMGPGPTTAGSRASTSWKASRPPSAGSRPTTSTSTRRTGTIATRRSRRRSAPSTTSCARARCAISAPPTTWRGASPARSGKATSATSPRYESLQPKYNLVFRDEYERELEPLCLEQGVGVIPYSSLGSGFLSGKYRRGAELPATARAAGVQKAYMTDRGFAILEAVEKVAVKLNATPAQVALSWLAHRPGITAPIASATSVSPAQGAGGRRRRSSWTGRRGPPWIAPAPGRKASRRGRDAVQSHGSGIRGRSLSDLPSTARRGSRAP